MNSHRGLTRTAEIAQLAALIDKLQGQIDALAKAVRERETAASFSIRRFCERNGLSESQYFKLKRHGKAPRSMKTGSVGVRISRQAETDWIIEREREAAAAARVAATTTAMIG